MRKSDSWYENSQTRRSLALEALLLNRLWPANPVNRRYRAVGLDYTVRQEVEQPAGAFLMVPPCGVAGIRWIR